MGVLFNDVVITKLSGGLGRRTPDQDMISGLLFDGPNTFVQDENGNDTADVLLNDDQLYRLASLEDAEGLGITSSYDQNGISAYYQIGQFFRLNPSGDLYIMKSDKSTYATLVDEAETMLIKAEGQIRQLAVIHSDTVTFAATITAVGRAQVIASEAFSNHRPVEVFLEGKGFDATATSFDNLSAQNAENVSVVIAMDQEKASEANYSNTAAVGVLLGAVSRARVSENIAWIEKFNLTGDGFRSVGFVGGGELRSEGEQKTLDEFKYIFTRSHIGIAGVYFNDSHTCTLPTSDFTYIESNRTIHKAARLSRAALLPKVNAPVLVDPDTGKLPPSVVKGYETLCRSALERMVANGEASEIDVFVDPNQNILSESILRVKIEIIPTGTARRIKVDLGFKNPFGLNA